MNNALNNEKNLLIPDKCPSCGSPLIEEGVHLVCENLDCPERVIQYITYWITENEMDDISESTIRTLYENKFIKDLTDLYTLDQYENFIKALPGFGEKKVKNLFEQIEKSRTMNTVQFIARLGIDLVGEKAIQKLGIKTIDDFWKFDDGTYKIGQNLIAYRKYYKPFILKLMSLLNIQDVVNKQTKGKVSMTGNGHKGRKELIKELEGMEYEFVDGITKETDILITDDVNSDSGKMKKANKLGIKIMSYEEFFK